MALWFGTFQILNIHLTISVILDLVGWFIYECQVVLNTAKSKKHTRSKWDYFNDVLTLCFLPATSLQVKMSVDTVRPKGSAGRSCGLVPENLSNSRWWRAWPATLTSATWPATPSLISLKLWWGQFWTRLHSHHCFNNSCNIGDCWDTYSGILQTVFCCFSLCSCESLTLVATYPEVHGRLPHQTSSQSYRADWPDLWSSHPAWSSAGRDLLPDYEADDLQQQQVLLQCVCTSVFEIIHIKSRGNISNPLWFFPPFSCSPSLSGWVWSVGGSWCGCVQACSRPVAIWWDTLSASWSRGPEICWLLAACTGCRRCSGQSGVRNRNEK